MTESILTEKLCPFCMETKAVTEFHKCKALKDGLSNRCKACVKIYSAENKERIRARNKEWKLKNRERINAERRAQRSSKSEAIRARRKGGHESMAGVALRDKPVLIYGLIDPRNNELRYVGKTEANLLQRLRSHIHRATVERTSLHVSRWLALIIADGIRPQIVLIDTVPPGGDWREAECFWIEYMRALGCRMTNLTPGGDFGGVPTPEYRERLSNSMKGRVITPEARAKISEANKGRKLTPEQIERRANAQRGAKRSDEFSKFCAERQKARKGTYTLSDEAREGIKARTSGEANPFFGKTHSKEVRELISQTHPGRKHTDEAKLKIAEAGRARHQRDRERKLSAQRSLFTSDSEMVSVEISRNTKSVLE